MTFQELDSSQTPPTYSICFSAASTLRCDAPSHLQLLLLLIPPVLEIILSLFLVLKEWKSASMRGKGFWGLLAEGWLYAALAVADVVARIYHDPAGRVTRIVELVVGGLSTLSLLLYTIFLFLLLITSRPNASHRGPLISSLPTRLQSIAKALIIITIPFLLTSNAFSNFFGISFSLGHAGFTTASFFDTHTFLASLTLALLSLFSALSFLLLAYQSLLVLTHDSPGTSSQERVHLMCGLPYLALGTKFAFIEAIAGFAPMAFPGVLFRRILRFGGRTALVWGGIRGLDWEEDFRGQGGLAQVLKGNGMAIIGLPRALSPQEDKKGLLRPLSPTIRYQGRVIGHPYASRDSYTPAVPPGALVDSGSVPLRRGRAGERVTVHYQQGYAPHLEMRLSGLGVPDTGTLVRNIKEQGLLDDVWEQSEGMERKKSIREMRQERKQKERELDQISQVSGLRVYSISSEDWNIVRFSTPPNTSPSPISIPPPAAVQRAATTISNSSSLRRKPVPALLSPLPRHVGIRHSNGSGLPSPMTAASQASFASGGTYQTQGSGDWLATASKGRYAAATYRTTGVSHASLPMPTPSAVGGLQGNPFSPGPGSTGDVDNYNENSNYRRESDGSALSAAHTAEIVKIKAIGTAPHKVTPPPTRVGFWRSSVEIERGVTPSRLSSSEDEADEVDSGEGTKRKDVDFGVDSPMLGHAV